MCGDILHCPRHIFHGCVAACPYPDTVAQHKRSITHLVHLPRRRYALADLGAGDQGISTQHQCIFPVFRFSLRRKIVQLHNIPAGVLRNFLCRIQRVGDLDARIIIPDQLVEALCRILCRPLVGELFKFLCTPVGLFQGAVLLTRVGVQAGAHDAGIFPQLIHRGLRGNVSFAVFCRPCGQCQSQQHPDAHCSCTEFVFHCRASFFIRPVLPRTQLPPSTSLQRLCHALCQCCVPHFYTPASGMAHHVPAKLFQRQGPASADPSAAG